jgi:hypothetical protein
MLITAPMAVVATPATVPAKKAPVRHVAEKPAASRSEMPR